LSNGKYCWGPKASHYLTWYWFTRNYQLYNDYKGTKEWNKANGEDEKSILPGTAHFDEYFEG
jgi:hypothetical protein